MAVLDSTLPPKLCEILQLWLLCVRYRINLFEWVHMGCFSRVPPFGHHMWLVRRVPPQQERLMLFVGLQCRSLALCLTRRCSNPCSPLFAVQGYRCAHPAKLQAATLAETVRRWGSPDAGDDAQQGGEDGEGEFVHCRNTSGLWLRMHVCSCAGEGCKQDQSLDVAIAND